VLRSAFNACDVRVASPSVASNNRFAGQLHPSGMGDIDSFWNTQKSQTFSPRQTGGDVMLKGLLLWALGVPFFVVVLLWMFVF
jgi:hypothetical protein